MWLRLVGFGYELPINGFSSIGSAISDYPLQAEAIRLLSLGRHGGAGFVFDRG